MQWIDRMNDAAGCMERHLTDEIDYEPLAHLACCSSYHFRRMFAYMAGVAPSAPIRSTRNLRHGCR